MQVQSLGHVVLKVDLEKSEAFYSGVLGMPVCARFNDQGMNMVFFSLGNHHDLAIAKAQDAKAPGAENAAGLHHVAFCIGTRIDDLIEAKAHLEGARRGDIAHRSRGDQIPVFRRSGRQQY